MSFQNEMLAPMDEEGLTLRWKLELAKKQMAARKELRTIVQQYSTKRHQFLNLIGILFREKNIFLNTEDIKKEVFYNLLKVDLVNSCWELMQDFNRLTPEDAEALFYLLIVFDVDNVILKLPEILEKSMSVEDIYLRIMLQLFVMDEALVIPSRLARHYEELTKHPNLPKRLSNTTDRAAIYWRNRRDTLIDWRRERIHAFRTLSDGVLHDAKKMERTIKTSLETNSNNLEKIVLDWAKLSEHLQKSLPLIRKCVDNHVNPKIVEHLDGCAYRLRIILEEADKIITTLENEKISELEHTKIFSDLTFYLNQIMELTVGKNGIKPKLENLKTNLKEVIYHQLVIFEGKLRNKSIELLPPIYPDTACIVFGEDIVISNIVSNLLENVIKHSKASKLLIHVELDINDSLAIISFIDNGIGFNAKSVIPGGGFKNVEKDVHSNCGEFRISEVIAGEHGFDANFKTKATVKLPYFRVSK